MTYPYFCANLKCANVLSGGGACGLHYDEFAEQVARSTNDPTYGIPTTEPYNTDDGFHFPPSYGRGLTPEGDIWSLPGADFMKFSNAI